MTQEFLLDTLCDELRTLFDGYTLNNSLGIERAVQVYAHELPIREGDDEETDPEAPPEPFLLVWLDGGGVDEINGKHSVSIKIEVCIHDAHRNRQGYRDALHMVNAIMLRFGADNRIGRKWTAEYPIKWALQNDSTHPYYYASVSMTATRGAEVWREMPEW